jgi:hypothetical protein
MRPDEELLGVVVHSGLVLARSQDVVAALRQITAFPAGLSLDAVVLAREVHAEAADRREREARTRRTTQAVERRAREATAQQESKAAAQWEGAAAAERERLRKRAITEQRYLPQFQEGDTLRLAVLGPAGDAQWLDAYQAISSRTEARYRLEASYLGDAASSGWPAHPDLCLAGDRATRGADRCRPSRPGHSGGWSSGAVGCHRGLMRTLPA